MTKVLVTGANGHVGANTVRSLLARGHDVIPMVRQGSDLRGLEGLGLTYRYADVLDAEAVRAAVRGCEVVVHCAAKYAMWARDPEEIMSPCVTGTRNIFTAARDEGVRRMVYTSSVVAVGVSRTPDRLRTAADWHEDPRLPYAVAKAESEREAIRLAAETRIDTVRLCPSYVMGPWDYRVTPSMKVWGKDLVNGRGFTFEGGINLVHAADVGEIHARAVDMGEPGARYILGGENVSVVAAGELARKWTGVKPLYLPIGRTTAMACGSVLDAVSKVTGWEPLFSREMAYEQVNRYSYFDSSETYRVFGLAPKSADQCIFDSIRWLLHIGAVQRKLPADVVERLAPEPGWVTGAG